MYSVSADRPACLNGRTNPFTPIYERRANLDARRAKLDARRANLDACAVQSCHFGSFGPAPRNAQKRPN